MILRLLRYNLTQQSRSVQRTIDAQSIKVQGFCTTVYVHYFSLPDEVIASTGGSKGERLGVLCILSHKRKYVPRGMSVDKVGTTTVLR